eukprot:3603384-Rhodomonas_salina.2
MMPPKMGVAAKQTQKKQKTKSRKTTLKEQKNHLSGNREAGAYGADDEASANDDAEDGRGREPRARLHLVVVVVPRAALAAYRTSSSRVEGHRMASA